MSEPRLISPMLDSFALGGAISSHSGVSCYPAMRTDSDERYILKTISVPASQLQLEALLLTGAYPNAEAAREYFKDLAKGIRSEIEILDKLAARRGFLSFADSQIVPMDEGVGYEIYLLSFYRRTLERHLKKEPLTHLSAVNLGIDLCAALALCREMGYLYVGLKPSNIFINTASQSYHLGDLGFVRLDSLKYTSLPDRYRSDYIPPEVGDAFATLNTTMDTYALGLVLYQIYNNAQLPFADEAEKAALMAQLAAGESLTAPVYADYEMAEIILKACAYDPADRWQTPEEMAQALIGYMKRNGVNDVPIVPPAIPEPEEEPFEPEYEDDDLSEELEGEVSVSEDEPAEEAAVEETAAEEASDEEEAESEEAQPEEAGADWIDRMDAILSEDGETESAPDGEEEPSLRQLLEEDGAQVDEADEALEADSLSEETASLMDQVQELIEHEAPAPVVAPEPIEIPMPEPIVLEEEEAPSFAIPGNDLFVTDEDEDEEEEFEPVDELTETNAKTWKRLVGAIVALVLLAALAFGGYYYYRNYYQQEIQDMTVEGHADSLTVTVVSDMDMSLLTVVCKDTYGNLKTAELENGQAVFKNLQPGSQYIISLEVEGFHELVNASPKSYSTPERTQIVNLNAVTGAEDGAAIISFGVEGPESEEWVLTCSTSGEEDKVFTFTGHNYTVVGLTPGAAYTLTLSGNDNVYLIGDHQLQFTAQKVIYAQNLAITSCVGNSMTIAWESPEGVQVSSWTARCYNEEGFDETIVVTEPTATFSNISPDSPYTLEVTAEGMTQSMRTYITANPVTITGMKPRVNDLTIELTWYYEGKTPESGWLVFYTVDGSTEQQVIETFESSITIYPAAPGSHYEFMIQSADATSIFNGTASLDVPALSGETFSGYGLRASGIKVTLHKVRTTDFDRYDLTEENATAIYSAGDVIGLKYFTSSIYQMSAADITTLIVIRDAEGRLAAVSARTRTWDDMWESGYCAEQMTQLPTIPGSYTMSVYLNGMLLTEQNITIS